MNKAIVHKSPNNIYILYLTYLLALPIIRDGLPKNNDDGTKNDYWERWPKLRETVNLYLGVGE